MLKRKPVLMGTTELDQLEKIFEFCGSPNDKDWPGFQGYPAFSTTVETIKKRYKRSIVDKFGRYESF
jgi:hypothetical protein